MKLIEVEKKYLLSLAKATDPKKQISILRKATTSQIKAISELLLNYEEFPTTCKEDSRCLRKYRSKIQCLVKKLKSISIPKLKKEYIKLSAIIPIIVGYSLNKILEGALSILFSDCE